ncbi:hypothetical protein AX16_004224 [Volvariella volvacea WC 439]|nr:hypothetical protein AX16_004224 [Volvariella volvacea WC 439]
MDNSREDFPRVSIDTATDWQRVKGNYKRTILAHYEELIKQNGLETEKDAILAHATQCLDLSVKMAEPNLRVNGQAVSSEGLGEEQDTEAFDEALDRRIWSMAETKLQWQKRLAQTRREVPTQMESKVSSILGQHQNADGEEAKLIEDLQAFYPLLESGKWCYVPQRRKEIEEDMRKLAALVEELQQGLPKQKERAERLRVVAAEVKALKP